MSQQQVRIQGGTKSYTSFKSAKQIVERGIADWVDYPAEIRLRPLMDCILEHREAAEVRRTAFYWHEVAAQRGGSEERLVFDMRKAYSRASELAGAPHGLATVIYQPVLEWKPSGKSL